MDKNIKPISKENLKQVEAISQQEKLHVETIYLKIQYRREIIDYLESKGYDRTVIYRVLKRCFY